MDTAVQAELDKLKELIINAIPVDIINTKKSRYLWLKNGLTMELKIAREGILLYG